jgi:hypothetical protein
MKSRVSKQTVAVGVWVLLIFTTSCFVVPFDTFVHFIQSLLPNSVVKSWFAAFWLVSWLFVVKGWHATEYFLLTVLCGNLLKVSSRLRWPQIAIAAFSFAVMFAASDEWHQTFVKGRDGNARDVLIDSCGALIGALLLAMRRANPAVSGRTIRLRRRSKKGCR